MHPRRSLNFGNVVSAKVYPVGAPSSWSRFRLTAFVKISPGPGNATSAKMDPAGAPRYWSVACTCKDARRGPRTRECDFCEIDVVSVPRPWSAAFNGKYSCRDHRAQGMRCPREWIRSAHPDIGESLSLESTHGEFPTTRVRVLRLGRSRARRWGRLDHHTFGEVRGLGRDQQCAFSSDALFEVHESTG